MFDIRRDEQGIVRLSGRFDASQAQKARTVLDDVEAAMTIDFSELKYISSAGIGELLHVQKRLMASGQTLHLANMTDHIKDIFTYAGLHTIFKID